MKKISLLTFGLVLALFFVPALPNVNAAQERVNSARAEELLSASSEEGAPESTGNYVKNKARLLKDATDEEKVTIRTEILERVKTKAEYAIQNAVRRYEQVKTQVTNSNLSDEAKESVNAKIDEQITAMNTLSNQVKVAESVDEVKNVMTKLKTQFKFSLGVVRQAVQGVFELRLENIIEKIKMPYTKISEQVSSLEEGEQKIELAGYLAEAEALIASAEAKIESGDLIGAKNDLVSAREVLKKVVTELKALEG